MTPVTRPEFLIAMAFDHMLTAKLLIESGDTQGGIAWAQYANALATLAVALQNQSR